MRREDPLSLRQVEVLRWISDGCPDGVWSDFSYKTTAYALAARGLVEINRRRKQWTAAITERGEFYLLNGHYPNAPNRQVAHAVSAVGHPDRSIADLATELLIELKSGDGVVVVRAPSAQRRARYRQAIHRLIVRRQVPDGFVLRHTGRDAGNLTIRLVQADTDDRKVEPPSRISVPETEDALTPRVKVFAEPGQLAVSAGTIARALRILQAIANECAARGWTLDAQPADPGRFRISTSARAFDLSLTEELEDREVPDDEQMEGANYGWQRVPLRLRKVGSGRLTLRLEEPYARKSWSDRRRWTLEDKLGVAFAEFQRRMDEAAERRRKREEHLLHRQREWDAAVLTAKQAYVIDLNRRRLREQVAKHADAQAFRDYSSTLNSLAESRADLSESDSIRQWQQWATTEADRIDPINNLGDLRYIEPDTVGPDDFGPFMPKGMSPYRRPID